MDTQNLNDGTADVLYELVRELMVTNSNHELIQLLVLCTDDGSFEGIADRYPDEDTLDDAIWAFMGEIEDVLGRGSEPLKEDGHGAQQRQPVLV